MILNGEEVKEILVSRQDGKLVNILNWTVEDMPIKEIAHNLAHINRYGGAQPLPVSVGLHSILVSYLVPEALAYEALMHDATEALCGDIMSTVKAHLPQFRDIELEVRRQLARNYSLPIVESRRVKTEDLRARELECFCRRGGQLHISLREYAACSFLLMERFEPTEVAEMFVARYDLTRQLACNWH